MLFVEGQRFFEDAAPGLTGRRDGLEQIPGALAVVGSQHAAAAHRVTALGVARTVQSAAHHRVRLQDGDVRAQHAGVADKESSASQGADAPANEAGLAGECHGGGLRCGGVTSAKLCPAQLRVGALGHTAFGLVQQLSAKRAGENQVHHQARGAPHTELIASPGIQSQNPEPD